jgi:hypothetical protein
VVLVTASAALPAEPDGSMASANVAVDGVSLEVPAVASPKVLDSGALACAVLTDSRRFVSLAVACVEVRAEVGAEPAGLGGGSAGAANATSSACIRGGAVDGVSSDESSDDFVFVLVVSSESVEAVALEALVAAPVLGVTELSSSESRSSSAADSFAAFDGGAFAAGAAFEEFGGDAPLGFEAGALGRGEVAVGPEAGLACPPAADVAGGDAGAEGVCDAALRAAEPASRLNGVGAPVAAVALFAPVWLAAAAGAGLTLSAGIEAPAWAALCALVRLALLLTVLCPHFLALAPFDDAIDHLGMLGRVLPDRAIRVTLGAGTAHDLPLLLNGFGEAAKEGLKLAQPRTAHAIRCPARELARVVRFVVLELLQLGFALLDATFACRESLRALPLLLVRYALRRP